MKKGMRKGTTLVMLRDTSKVTKVTGKGTPSTRRRLTRRPPIPNSPLIRPRPSREGIPILLKGGIILSSRPPLRPRPRLDPALERAAGRQREEGSLPSGQEYPAKRLEPRVPLTRRPKGCPPDTRPPLPPRAALGGPRPLSSPTVKDRPPAPPPRPARSRQERPGLSVDAWNKTNQGVSGKHENPIRSTGRAARRLYLPVQ